MNFLLDENFPKPAIQILQSRGHKAFDIRSTEHEGSDDINLIKLTQKYKAVFLTTDKDFFHTIPYQFKNHHGIIVITLRQPNRVSIIEKLKFVLDNFDMDDFKQKVILLKDNSYSFS